MDIMIEKVIMFALIIAVSFAATKAGWLNETVKEGLSRFIIKITAPLMLFSSIAGLEYRPSLMREAGVIIVIAFIIIFVLISLSFLYNRIAKPPVEKRGVQVCLMSFGNVAFLAYPLFEAVFGAIGVFYGAFYHLANDICFWTIGVLNLDYRNTQTPKQRIKRLFNQNLIAILLGLLVFLLQIKLPAVIFDPLAGFGKTTVYLSLAFIGTVMASVDFKETYKKLSIYIIVLVKMLAVPFAVAFLLTRLNSFGLTYNAVCAVVLQVAMPSMTLVGIMANELKADYKYASEGIFATTAISLITMPVMLWIINYLI